jgi:hypothetical protein
MAMDTTGTQSMYEEPTGSPHGQGLAEPRRALLVDADDRVAARAAAAIWAAQDRLQDRRLAQWRVNEWRRSGIKNVRLRRAGSRWYAWVPPHIESNPDALQSMNAAANQCRKFLGIMLADPPAPETQAATGAQEDVASAEFAKRALLDCQNDRHLNDQRLIRRAFDKASTYGSGFVWYYIDPQAGDKTPVKILAGVDASTGRAAQTPDEAVDDPMTGGAWPDYVERYVTEGGTLSADPRDAKTDWVGSLRGRVLTGRNVRMYPHTVSHISEAHGVQIGYYVTLGELQRLYPDMRNLPEEKLADLVAYRPEHGDWLLSDEERHALGQTTDDRSERLVFCLVTYFTASDEFPQGLYMVTAGDSVRVLNEPWIGTTPDGHQFELPLPVTQYAQFGEGSDNAYAHGLMEILGPGNEVRGKIIADWLTHLTKINNRKTFLPVHSNIQERDLKKPGHSYIRILPGAEPKYEQVESFSPDAYQFMTFATNELQMASGLTQIAQGLESPQVQSGRHAQAIVSQVHAGLSDVRQNIIDGYLLGCRIQLALMKAFYARERRIGFVGEDGAYKERYWTGSDLANVADVYLANGTLTMLTPVAKAQLAEHLFTLGAIDQVRLQELTTDHMGPLLNLQQDSFRDRIKRQLAFYMQGPPEGWEPQFAPPPPPQLDPMTGMPLPQPPAPQEPPQQEWDPVLRGIWRPYPADDLPHVALARLRELAKAMSTSRFATLPEPWQWGLLQEFQRAQQAATPQGPQPGQAPPQQQSPAQLAGLQGPAALPATPLPTEAPGGSLPPVA